MASTIKKSSIQQRFIYGLGIVVGTVFIIISCSSIVFNSRSLDKELHADLDRMAQLSVRGLSSALWQYNYEYVEDYLASLFQYQDLVFASVYSDSKLISKKVRNGTDERDADHFSSSGDFIVKQTDILHHDVVIGKIHLVLSRERIDTLIVRNSLLAISFLAMIVSAISITIFILTRKYVFTPLNQLEDSARAISQGLLDTEIKTNSEDEIGQLARAFDQMVKNLKTTMASRDELEAEVTERRRVEKALSESEQRFKLAMEFANDGLWDWDLQTNEIFYSPVWKQMLGYGNDELPNDFSAWEALTAPEDVKRLWKIKNELINKQRDKFELEFKMKHKDGHWVDILSRANAIFDENSRAVRILGTHVDISERKKLENQLLQSQKLESIGNLAGGIAHEFNNILSIIIGNNELVMDELPQWSSAVENAEEIRIAGFRARDIVKQLLLFSRQDDARQKPIDTPSVVKESIKLIRSSTPTNISIQQNIPGDVAPIVGNPTQINQILINLCSNASDAMMDTGGSIQIDLFNETINKTSGSTRPILNPGQYVKLIVKDTGSGMDRKTLGRIFEPYFTTKEIGKGTGIGLAVVHGIVEKHGGSISVESESGKGTTFTILFPACQDRIEQETEDHTTLPTGSEQILFVDDESILLKLGKQRLERLGYRVQGATDPRDALEMFKAAPDDFDLIITDMAMPHLTGDQLVLEIFKIRPGIATMLCTGYSEKISAEKAYEIGFKAFVMKPIDRKEFAIRVRSVLDETRGPTQV